MSPYRWSAATKRLVSGTVLVLAGILIYVVREILPLVAMAAVLAYLLQPLVGFLIGRGLKRGLASGLVFLLLIVLLLLIPALLIPALVRSAASVDLRAVITSLVANLHALLREYRSVQLAGNTIDLGPLVDPLEVQLASFEAGNLPNVGGLFGAVSGAASNAVVTILGLLGTLAVVLITSFYIVIDTPLIREGVWSFIPEPARPEMKVLAARLNRVWASFFRGQLLLGTVVGVATTIGGLLIGLPGALWLGLIAGILEVVPNIGPVLSAIPALAVALVQGSTVLPVDRPVFMLITLGLYVVIQQLENNLLVPRIIGDAVGLPPVVVLLGAIVGASTAGLLGVFLAAPAIASVALLARYVYNKLFDRPPFDDMPATEEGSPTLAEAQAAVAEEAAEEAAEEGRETLEERKREVGEKPD